MVGALTQWKKRKKENKDREREWMVPFPLGSWIHTLRSQKPSVWLPTPGPHTLYHESLRWVRTYANMLATWRVLMSMVGPTRNQDLLLARHGFRASTTWDPPSFSKVQQLVESRGKSWRVGMMWDPTNIIF